MHQGPFQVTLATLMGTEVAAVAAVVLLSDGLASLVLQE